MDHLKEGIGLRGYGQKDPLVEYKKEAFTLFQGLMDSVEDEIVRNLFFMRIEAGEPAVHLEQHDLLSDAQFLAPQVNGEETEHGDLLVAQDVAPEPQVIEPNPAAQKQMLDFTRNIQRKKEKELEALQFISSDTSTTTDNQPHLAGPKVGRNDPCPCGSGKKYKKCHGA
jgi:preprotein translocase subunit SecA